MQQFEGTALTRLEYEEHGTRVVLQKGEAGGANAAPVTASVPVTSAAAPTLPQPQTAVAGTGSLITAPLVGIFYAAPAPGAVPFAAPGTAVKKGDTVCVLEAMQRYGNTSAASIPLALDELFESGALRRGQTVACIGFGAGLTWGGILLRV